MNQINYDFVRELHEEKYRIAQRQRQLQSSSLGWTSLYSRSMLMLSDLLLGLGKRIRPAQFQVHVHDGTLETNPEGC